MDNHRFDALSRLLARTFSRRRATPVVASVVAGLAAVVASDDTAATKKPNKSRCLATGARCTAHSGGKGDHCRRCCSRHSIPRTAGKGRRCACKPKDAACTRNRECCTRQCIAGSCQNLPCGAGGPCRVFVTSTAYQGNFGGVTTGDDLCTGLATDAGLGGTFAAWLSDASTTPATRLYQSPQPFIRVDGAVVAADWSGLTSGSLLQPISLNERGGGPGAVGVWTGTYATGERMQDHWCDGWTMISPPATGSGGNPYATNGAWSNEFSFSCSYVYALYCVEQPAS